MERREEMGIHHGEHFSSALKRRSYGAELSLFHFGGHLRVEERAERFGRARSIVSALY
jgi:hypothetical protein